MESIAETASIFLINDLDFICKHVKKYWF